MTVPGGLVGRDDVLRRAVAALRTGRHVVIRGEAGVGKSALAAALVDRPGTLRLRGVSLLSTVPYLPLRRAIPALDVTAGLPQLAHRLRRRIPAAACVLADDIHWFDDDTLTVLGELASMRPLVLTTRPDAGRAGPLVASLLPLAEFIDVERLDDRAALDLVRTIRPAAPASDHRRWVAAAGGLPLTLSLSAHGQEASSGADDAARAVAALDDPRAIDLLARLALRAEPPGRRAPGRRAPGRRAPGHTAANSVGLPAELIDDLVGRGLAVVDDDGVRPAHPTIGEAAVAALDTAARQRLHDELAGASEDDAVRALHLAAAGHHDDATDTALTAAGSTTAPGPRARLLRLAADCASPRRPELDREAAAALSLAGDYQGALALLPVPREPVDSLVEARCHWATSDIGPARAAVEAGLAAGCTGPAVRAELLSLRSRIRCRVDFDLPGAFDDARLALSLAGDDTSALVAAHSALGLTLLMWGDMGWAGPLDRAGRLAIGAGDVHNAVSAYDTLFFAELLSGDPRRCAPIAAEMIELTESTSRPWNAYFRAVSLLAALHVDGDHRAVLSEADHLHRRPLTPRAAEALRTARVLALLDAGRDLEAVDAADEAVARASDDSSGSLALAALAEACWIAGESERAVDAAQRCAALPPGGFLGLVFADLAGQWARFELGQPVDPERLTFLATRLRNLSGAGLEARALAAAPREAIALFDDAAAAWRPTSVRCSLRASWAAAASARAAGLDADALERLHALGAEAGRRGIVWLARRITAELRELGVTTAQQRPLGATTGRQVLARVARGQPSVAISRSLRISPATVDSHVRTEMKRTGASTRLQAAALSVTASATVAPLQLRTTPGGGTARLTSVGIGHGAEHVDLAELRPQPWALSATTVVTGAARTPDERAALLLAIARGASVDVRLPGGDTSGLVDALRRLGADVETRAAAPSPGRDAVSIDALDDLDRRLVRRLAAGATVTQISDELGYSRRTIQRRLTRLRATLGVASTDEVVVHLAAGPGTARRATAN